VSHEEQIKTDQKALRELRQALQRQRRWLWISVVTSTLALLSAATLFYLNTLS
jgi:hypothetical protein